VSHCPLEQLEAFCRGELEREEAARLSAHIAACPTCAEEERWLRRERRLFKARAEAHPPPPSLASILAAARAEAPTYVAAAPVASARPAPRAPKKRQVEAPRAPKPRRPWLVWLPYGFGLAAAAALMLLFCASPAEDPPPLSAETLPQAPAEDTCYACTQVEPAPEEDFENESNCMSMTPVTSTEQRPQKK